MSATPPAAGPSVPPSGASVPLSGEEEAVIRAFSRVMQVMPRALHTALEREQRMSLSEYTVLRMLSEAPDRKLRMSVLAAACDMSLSGMTRLVGKLESAGLLVRAPCPSDARGQNAVLTDAGLARLQQAWPTHLASVRRHVMDHLDDVDLGKLTKALEAMAATAL
jgi:DNA-binding MarR family transcriptional regulator